MSRSLHRTPRHLDDPLRILGFTLAQWLVLALAAVVLWGCLALLPDFIPATLRLSLGAALVGIPLGLTFASDATRSLLDLPRRAWHSLATPGDALPGPPHRGPLALTLVETRAREEDGDA